MTTTPNTTSADIAEAICQAVAELDDRDSPADWPEAMLVTSDELHQIVTDALAASAPAPQQGVAGEREAFEHEMRCEETWGHRSLSKFHNGDYKNTWTGFAWEVWRARAAKAPAAEPVAWRQFMADVLTAAGLVSHGKQCKALGDRLMKGCTTFRAPPAPTEQWMPIETAPRDGTIFIACIDGLPYKANYDEFGRFIWYVHHNRAGRGRCYQQHNIDGKKMLEVISEGEDDNYEVMGILWSRGFDHQPTGWIPAPPQGAAKGGVTDAASS